MVCYFNEHWATCVLDLVACTVEIWDSKQHIFQEHHYDIRRAAFKPVARIVPQVLKHMRFYDNRPEDMPTFKEWLLYFPEKNVIRQNDSESCGPLSLKYAENRLMGVVDEKMNKKDIQKYRNHIAETIYKFSTDASTIQA